MLNNIESEEEQRIRFQVELEFVQCLANPNYLNYLAQRDFFKNPAFINYLKYLLYWKRQEYAKYLKFPQCLHILELLQTEEFRTAMTRVPNSKFLEDQMLLQWQFYIRKRVRAHNEDGVRLPSRCETCKYLALELEARFSETGQSPENTFNGRGGTKKYRDSELRFIETMENLCDRLLDYNLHKEHKNSLRFARGQSETMKTLHGLVNRGVQVELGLPYELWDSPSVEVTRMKQDCETMLENNEEAIERWYYAKQKEPLRHYLCENRVLNSDERECLYENQADSTPHTDLMLSQVIRQMRRLDAYSKPVEDFRIRTAFGGTVTLISSVVIGILFFNELMIYLSTEIVEELLVDTTVGDARLKINFDIVFPAMACSFLSVDAMDASGQFQNDVTENVWKEPIHWSENNVGTTMPTVQQSKAANCGSCYGAETSEIQCCNSCDDVIKAYKRKGWALNSMDSVEQCRDREWVQKLHHSLNQGCHIYGWLEVSKVTGNFHIAPGSSVKDVHVHVHNLHQLGPSAFNTSHTIKHFSFGESFPGKKFPLDGETVIANKGERTV
ncbi:Endoplasmic reticulum-Golgi intermediate compartment protein 3 [Trichinella patagoniensis]|uniref:Mediator of RNA polymerase II transcription subunit 31 n=1 Tax=Trichinella patagoniensis TaxID=990121 RepID=A0A0V1AFU8_9BILA|nr:Endoplasmic reticulum-Golgi intermediate compartment protein 3 [Trichinella patagoniensis]